MKIARPLLILVFLSILGVITFYAERDKAHKYSVLSGTFENLPTEVASRTSGRVLNIFVVEGQTVKKGERLLELDPGPLRTELQALKSREKEAQIQLKDMQAGYRAEDIAKQKALVEELQANADMLENGYRPEEVAEGRARLDFAEANYAKQKNGPRVEEIAQARAQLDSAKTKLEFETKENERYTSLFKEGAVSKQELERHHELYKQALSARDKAAESLKQLERGYRVEDQEAARAEMETARQKKNKLEGGYRQEERAMAQAKLRQAQAQLALMKNGYRPQEIEKAKAALETARLNVKAAQERLNEYVVTAPIDGVVETRLVAVGDLVNSGVPLVRMSDPKDIWIKVYLAADKLALVKVGDKGKLSIDGLNGWRDVYVEQIATSGEYTPVNLQTPEERGRQVYCIKLRLDQPDEAVKAGMNATVKSLGQWKDQ